MMAGYVKKEDWENAALWGEKYVLLDPSDADGWKTWPVLHRARPGRQGQRRADALSTLKGE